MEIVEAILAFFKKNNTAVINIVFPFIAIVLIFRDFSKELMLVLVPVFIPIAISFYVTRVFRNKDKEEAQSIRDRDKEDNDARNLRTELREYFLTNCKPTIDEIVDGKKMKGYLHLKDKDDNSIDIETLKEIFENHRDLFFMLPKKIIPLSRFTSNISHKEYKRRFYSYQYIINHIKTSYIELIHLPIINIQTSYLLNKMSSDQKDTQLIQINCLIIYIDCFLEESELILFNYKFDKDDAIFKKHMDVLDKAILDTGLANAKDFLFNREALEELLESLENETTETK